MSNPGKISDSAGRAPRVTSALLSLLLPVALLTATASPALAAVTIVVTTTEDVAAGDAVTGGGVADCPPDGSAPSGDDACTLRAAVQVANSTPTVSGIELPAGTYELTIAPDDTEPDGAATGALLLVREDPIAISGPEEGLAVIDGGWRPAGHVDGGASGFGDRLLELEAEDVTIEKLTFMGGYIDGNGTAGQGAALFARGAPFLDPSSRVLTLRDTTFTTNSAIEGGAVRTVQGMAVTIEDSEFRANEARDDDPDDLAFDGLGGAILAASGTDLDITGSVFEDNTALDEGGAIYLDATSGITLAVADSTFTSNSVAPEGREGVISPLNFGGGAVGWPAGASSSYVPTFTDVSFTGNDAGLGAGGAVRGGDGHYTRVTFDGNSAGMAGAMSGNGIVVDSTFLDNVATSGDDVAGGGAIWNQATITVSGSTFAGNTAFSVGGALRNLGGEADSTVTNSTFTGNTAVGAGGAIHVAGGPSPTFALVSSTIVDNTAAVGSGVWVGEFVDATASNTIVADNTGDDCAGDAELISLGYNLEGGTTCGFTATDEADDPIDLQDTSPLLAALAENGGDVQTRAPLEGSPVIDAGLPAAHEDCDATTDQRDLPRPQGASCDIGAVEYLSAGNADLSDLTLSDGTLAPAFEMDTTSYTAEVDNEVTGVDITATLDDAAATLTIGGQAATNGVPEAIELAIGENTVVVGVIAEDGITTRTYEVVITRAAGDPPVMESVMTSATDADVIEVTYDAALDCDAHEQWAPDQFAYDFDGTPGDDTPAVAIDCSGSLVSLTFPHFTVFDAGQTDELRYDESATPSERVTDGLGNPADAASMTVEDGTGPALSAVELSIDGVANGAWDAVDDVLTVRWTESVSLDPDVSDGGGYEHGEEVALEALLGLDGADLELDPSTVVVVDESVDLDGNPFNSEWSLRITGAPLVQGVALGAETNGSTNGDVTDDMGNAQVAAADVTLAGGSWMACDSSYAGVTIDERCIESFTATDDEDGHLELDVFEMGGMLQIQVQDPRRIDATELVAEGVAVVGGTVTGPLTTASDVEISLDLGDIDPTVLIGTAALAPDSYAISPADAGSHTLSMTVQPRSFAYHPDCGTGDLADCGENALIDYEGSLTFAVVTPDLLQDEAWADAFRGSWIMTDAQAFGLPEWGEVAFGLVLAAPATFSDGSTNGGFFDAFLAPGLFGPEFFDVDPSDAEYTATKDGTDIDIGGTTAVGGGVLIQLENFGYSTPEIAITAEPASTDGGGNGGGGGDGGDSGMTDRTVAPGDTVSTGADATPESPTQTSVTSPVAGTVTVAPAEAVTTELPEGQTALDIEVDITAPAATPDEPLALGFELDESLIEDVDLDRLVVYRNGEPVSACADEIAAVPDPCLAAAEVQDDGDLSLTVRTSAASTWNFATVDTACPAGLVVAGGFADVPADGEHATSIDCAAWWGLVDGTSAQTYAPGDPLTRGQVASVLFDAIDAAGAHLPFSEDQFGDLGGVHGDAVERLAAAEILSGRAEGLYEPAATVTRGQMASLLVGVLEHVSGTDLDASAADPFEDDDASPHHANIAKAVAAGLVNGTSATSFDPAAPVTRGQLASFVTNLLERLVEDGHADPPLSGAS